MKVKLIVVLLTWVIILCISFFWNVQSINSNQEALTLRTAKTLFNQMVVTRRWNSSHNGVYVKVTDTIKPNPYLKDPQRDLACGGILLTKINPAFMTRQLSDLTSEKLGVQFHVSGLNPLRPENGPDDWEKAALTKFSKGNVIEQGQMVSNDKHRYYMYMKGLRAEKSCLQCHSEKGYKTNDIIGGISIKIFNPQKAKIMPIILRHLIIGILGFLIILISGLKLINAYKTIHHQAIFDALTNIPNRRYFNDRVLIEIKQAKRLKTPISFIMADIDNFKNYNDFYGHAKGDEVLIQVAHTIQTTLKRPVDFCARFGGEEFIIVLPDTDEQGAVHIASQMISNVEKLRVKHEHSKNQDVVTISLGIASEPIVETDHETIMKKADTALYQAKANGKNQYAVFT